ncbi:MAG TPA: Type 1 glutamine amidotransferase-like domain-containing protein [Ktedonobacteraceae bacterium]|nr:Type 1 glutamine amidotransferase-like domain-containing protein [Ktedonobacteraceae bacterium]
MTGYLLLEGGAEFGGKMAEPDRRAIQLAGGLDAQISIIPTAAAPDNNYRRAGNNGVNWFRSLGAMRVDWIPVIDRPSANDVQHANTLYRSRLIYMLGGFTGFLGETLKGSACESAMRRAYEQGAVIAGSSAGAMVMCQYYFDPGMEKVVEGLNYVPNTCVLPHHNTFGKGWAARLTELLPGVTLLGIDERTGMIDDADESRNDERSKHWSVYGQGDVTVYHDGQPTIHHRGEIFGGEF